MQHILFVFVRMLIFYITNLNIQYVKFYIFEYLLVHSYPQYTYNNNNVYAYKMVFCVLSASKHLFRNYIYKISIPVPVPVQYIYIINSIRNHHSNTKNVCYYVYPDYYSHLHHCYYYLFPFT